jgi:Mg-chelatase subunit ChlD
VKLVASAQPAPEEPAGRWALAWRRIKAFFAAIARAFRRFWHWLLRKAGRGRGLPTTRPQKGALLIELPGIAGTLSGLDARFEGALLTSPELRKGMEARIREEAGPWRRLRFNIARRLGSRSYGRLAREAFKKQLLKLVSRRRREAEEERDGLDRRLEELRERRSSLERGLRAAERELESEKDRLLRDMGKRLELDPAKRVRENLEENLSRSGLISRDDAGNIRITARLIDRFAEIVLAGEIRNLPSRYAFALGRTPVNQGTFERDRLKIFDEVSRMDLIESLMMARLTHPSSRHLTEDDIRVNRELSGSTLHVVLVFDKSSSMAENNRILAAKKAVLALYKAVKRKDRRNIVDLVGFDTEVRPMDLVQVWESMPAGFTNTASALRVAHELVQKSNADLKIIYLITDGFPEAYTENGRNIAGDNEKSLALAIDEARELCRVRNVRLVHILLEPKERLFVDAAEKIVDAARGKLITTDPNRLAADMLMDYSVAVT